MGALFRLQFQSYFKRLLAQYDEANEANQSQIDQTTYLLLYWRSIYGSIGKFLRIAIGTQIIQQSLLQTPKKSQTNTFQQMGKTAYPYSYAVLIYFRCENQRWATKTRNRSLQTFSTQTEILFWRQILTPSKATRVNPVTGSGVHVNPCPPPTCLTMSPPCLCQPLLPGIRG